MDDLNDSDFASRLYIYKSLESWYVYTTFTYLKKHYVGVLALQHNKTTSGAPRSGVVEGFMA